VPQMAESISEGTLKTWQKKVGDTVAADEEVATIETDKVRCCSAHDVFLCFRSLFFGFLFFLSFIIRRNLDNDVTNVDPPVHSDRSTCPSTRLRRVKSPSFL